MTNIATVDTLDDLVEFNVPFTIDEQACFTTPFIIKAPETARLSDHVSGPADDIELDAPGWTPLVGFTGQYSYHGAIMHPSEYLGGGLAQHILEHPGTYVVLEVIDPDDLEAVVGWTILEHTQEN